MAVRYFKRFCEETTGEELTDSWGTCTYYFETDAHLSVLRQIQLFQNGYLLKYDGQHFDDAFGSLADQPLDMGEFAGNEMLAAEFLTIWSRSGAQNEFAG